MPLSRTNVGSYQSAGDHGGGSYTTPSFTPPSDSLLVVRVGCTSNVSSGDTRTNLSLSSSVGSPTLVVTAPTAPTWDYAEKIWVIPIGAASSMTVTADCGAVNVYFYQTHIVAYTGYNVGTPTGATATGTDSDGNGAATITLSAAPGADSEVVAAAGVSMDYGVNSMTAGSGWNEVYESNAPDWHGWQLQVRGGSTSTSVSWADLSASDTPGSAIMVAVEILAGGGAATSLLLPSRASRMAQLIAL